MSSSVAELMERVRWLRDYQAAALERAAGMRKVVFVAPTGSGKGTMAAHMLAEAARSGQRALFIAHLRDICEDIANRVRGESARVGMILPGHKRDSSAPVQIASVQSLLGSTLRRYDLCIVDEAHHYRADQWQAVLAQASDARLVGFTATPQRADGKGLGDVFDDLVEVATYAELRDKGLLVHCDVYAPARKQNGDIAMDPAEAYLRYARDRQAFIFLRNLKTADDVRKRLARSGVKAAIVTDETPYGERSEAVSALRTGGIQAIINYGTMTEGVDVPAVSAVILEQPCVHEGAFIQRAGRAMRAHDGKRDAIVVDLCGSVYRHGIPWTTGVNYNLGDEPIQLAGGLVAMRAAPLKKKQRAITGTELVKVDAEWLAKNGGPRFINWDAIEWDRYTDAAIARQLGCVTRATVRAERYARCHAPVRPNKRIHQSVIDRIDWSKNNETNANALGISQASVANIRRCLGKHLSKPWKRGDFDATKIDPSLSDAENARRLNCSVRRVRHARVKRGLPAWSQQVIRKYTDAELLNDPIAVVAERHATSYGAVFAARKRVLKRLGREQ